MATLRPAEEMKDSGIEWIGNVPREWTVANIRSCFNEVTEKNKDGSIKHALKFTYGEIVPKTHFDADEDDYVADTIKNYYVVSPGTIIINGLNLNFDFITQRVGLVKQSGIITSAYVAITPKDVTVTMPKFMTYLFKTYDARLAFHNLGGGVRKILSFSRLKSQKVCFPDLHEQQAIVSYLENKCAKIDEIIAEATASIEEYKQLKQAVIFEAVTKGLDKNVPMKDSGVEWIGEIPFHWRMGKIKNGVSKVGSGKTPKGGAEVYSTEGVLFLRSQNIYDDGLKLDNPFFITDDIDEDMKNTRVQTNDVLLNITGGSIGRCCVVPDGLGRANVNQHVSIIRAITTVGNLYKPCFFLQWLVHNRQKFALAER